MKIKHVTCLINGVQISGTPSQVLKVLDGDALEAFRHVLIELHDDIVSGRLESAGLSMVYQGIDITVTAAC